MKFELTIYSVVPLVEVFDTLDEAVAVYRQSRNDAADSGRLYRGCTIKTRKEKP